MEDKERLERGATPADPASDAERDGTCLSLESGLIGLDTTTIFLDGLPHCFSWLTAHAVKSPQITHAACMHFAQSVSRLDWDLVLGPVMQDLVGYG